MLLEGKKLLITGVLTDDSIAFSVAKVAQEAGAEILLTSFGRARSLTERVAKKLPAGAPDVLELDVNDASHIEEFKHMLALVLPDPAVARRIVKTARVTARLYALQIEEILP